MPADPTNPTPRRKRPVESEDEFWGRDADWSSTPVPPRLEATADSPSVDRRWWQRALSSGSSATRTHGVPAGRSTKAGAPRTPAPSRHRAPTADDTDPISADFLDDRYFADEMDWDTESWETDPSGQAGARTGWDGDWDVVAEPVAARRPGIDPLIARIGALVVVLTLAVPIVLGLSSSGGADESLAEASSSLAETVVMPTDATAVPTTTSAAAPATAADTTDDLPPATTAADTSTAATATAPATAPDTTEVVVAALETASEPATTVASCAAEYELAEGDYWIRIADAAGVRLADLLAANDATVETMLAPGRTICLPAGASTPSPPAPATTVTTTTAPATTQPPTTAAPTTAAPTTAAPTTAAPTTNPPPPAPVAPGDIEAIIRDIWPDDLEERALAIAWRESNYVPTAKNYCCYGLFQIYWNVHQSWLGGIGVTSAEQLYDPTTNARAAYALYQRSGGFGPWGG